MTALSNNKILISIEGNIGVGKSTFASMIKGHIDNSEIICEPIDIWKNMKDTDGENILQKFYKDIPRWAYSFQNLACISRMIKIEDTIRNTDAKYIFLDRSLGTDKNVFEKMLYDTKKISEIEHQMYNMWCDFYSKYIRTDSENIIIYLKCSPMTAYNRIQKRGRDEEKTIELAYLTDLNTYHDAWLLQNKSNQKIITIDCDREFENDPEYQYEIINKILTEIS
ncbi:MAG: deoxynucleoside kinase [Gaeavirus sp.]|uniref:Deoxynucleoside kinase n=1 Tax=Gaeavirus sp. TaxID=2487767 RepID=A0A3G5A280_9VIRU|nr:MAG: deoxynucleoside kinase [Gaeavirus sp.]